MGEANKGGGMDISPADRSETIKRPHHRKNVGNDERLSERRGTKGENRMKRIKGGRRGKKREGNEKRRSVSMRRDAWFRAHKFIPRLLIRRTSRVDRSFGEGKKKGLERRLKRTATLNGQEHLLRFS